jgi:hypothetical protein
MTEDFEFDDKLDDAGDLQARITYIKPTGSDEAHRLGLIPPGIELPPGVKLYVLHAIDGSVLGYTDAYASAYGAAVQNDLTPVSLH